MRSSGSARVVPRPARPSTGWPRPPSTGSPPTRPVAPTGRSNFGGGDHDSAWGAHRAIDGQMATEWASNGDGDGAWIALDFGGVRPLTRFEFRSRQMADGSSITTRLRLRFDGDRVLGPFDTPDPDVVYGFDLGEAVRTRTARVEAVTTTGGNTGAREICFLGPGS